MIRAVATQANFINSDTGCYDLISFTFSMNIIINPSHFRS